MQNLKPIQQHALRQLEIAAEGRELDPLERYCAEFLTQTPIHGFVPFAQAVWMVENVTSILLDRRGQFQVQMFAMLPGTIIPEHTHPNVDSIEVYVGGNMRLSHLGKYFCPEDEIFESPGPLGLASKRGMMVRVHPQDPHGGVIGEGGGVFMSVQHWLNGVKPHCVAADYDGVTLGEKHLSQVVCGTASAKKKLTPKDAASLEH